MDKQHKIRQQIYGHISVIPINENRLNIPVKTKTIKLDDRMNKWIIWEVKIFKKITQCGKNYKSFNI